MQGPFEFGGEGGIRTFVVFNLFNTLQRHRVQIVSTGSQQFAVPESKNALLPFTPDSGSLAFPGSLDVLLRDALHATLRL